MKDVLSVEAEDFRLVVSKHAATPAENFFPAGKEQVALKFTTYLC